METICFTPKTTVTLTRDTSKTPRESRRNTYRQRLHPKNAKHDIPGQRLVSGQQFPGNIGAIDPSGQLVALQESRSHPTKLSFKLSQLETVGSQGRKLTAEPLILVCTTNAFVRLLPRRAIKVTLIILLSRLCTFFSVLLFVFDQSLL